MKRVVQTRTGADGNCLAACMASILELPLSSVPEFGEDWLRDLNGWLAERGLAYRRVPMYAKPSGWSTIEGISPRGGLHACVAHDGELIWDPHPIEDGTGQGLVEPRYYGLLEPVRVAGGDRADMTQLRANTRLQGGPLLVQVTEANGLEHTVPTKALVGDSAKEWTAGLTKKQIAEIKKKIASRHRSLAITARKRELYGESAVYRKAKNGNIY